MKNHLKILFLMLSGLLLSFSLTASLQGCGTAKYEFVEAPREVENAGRTLQEERKTLERQFSIKATPNTVKVCETVTFEGLCGVENKGLLSWNFGDGKSGSGKQVTHKYASSKVYDVEAVCIDVDGHQLTKSLQVTVNTRNCCCRNSGR